MAHPYEHSADQEDPGAFEQGSFGRSYPRSFPAGVTCVTGTKPGSRAREVQSIRFDSSTHSPVEAKKWLGKNGYAAEKFEAASSPTGVSVGAR